MTTPNNPTLHITSTPARSISKSNLKTQISDDENFSRSPILKIAASPADWTMENVGQMAYDSQYDSGLPRETCTSPTANSAATNSPKNKEPVPVIEPSKSSKKNKKNKKKKNKNRKASVIVQNNDRYSSDENLEENREYELYMAVPRKRTKDIIGSKGAHLKKYSEKFGVDVTIVSGSDFVSRPNYPKLQTDENGFWCEDVIRFEAYRAEDIAKVVEEIQGRFWKLNMRDISNEISEHSDDDDFFAQFYHNGSFYANSEYMLKPKYSMQHTSIDEDTPWTHEKFYDEMQKPRPRICTSEKEKLEQAKIAAISGNHDHQNWREQSDVNVKLNKKKKKKNKPKKNWFGHTGQAASCLALNKFKETAVKITATIDYRNICVQQPTHPSHCALEYLEMNMFHFYSPLGQNY